MDVPVTERLLPTVSACVVTDPVKPDVPVTERLPPTVSACVVTVPVKPDVPVTERLPPTVTPAVVDNDSLDMDPEAFIVILGAFKGPT